MANTIPKTKLSKSKKKKEEKSIFWRNQKVCSDEIQVMREEFLRKVDVVPLDATSFEKSYSAIIDSRRGIVIK